jgi:hypothetical protein
MLRENKVEEILRKYLIEKGWNLTNHQKLTGIHGVDIKGYHPIWRKILLIEVKGDGKAKNQTIHNSFYTVLGQILSRMDKAGNNNKKARIYSIAIPKSWEKQFKNKIFKMSYGWKLLGLRVFLVSDKKVEEKPYSYFLKR